MGNTSDAATRTAQAPEQWRGDIAPGKPGGATLGAHLLGTAATSDEIAAVLRSHPEYAGPILVAVNQRFGNAVATSALTKAGLGDHSASVVERDTMGGDCDFGDAPRDPTAVAPSTVLPFTTDGWDGLAIASKLGQHDRIADTNNDGDRCTFANLLTTKILAGRGATSAYLTGVRARVASGGIPLVEGRNSAMAAAANVLAVVGKAIDDKTATFGDLSWAQESLYEIFADTIGGGTLSKEVTDFLGQDLGCFHIGKEVKGSPVSHNPDTGAGCLYSMEDVQDWCASLAEGRCYVCVWIGPEGRTQEMSHQIMLVKHGGKAYLYDPEVHGDGRHMIPITDGQLPLYFAGGRRIAVTLLTDPPAK